ncbi:MAG: tRNA (guanine(46)-N(7))-methyltransferase TrmB [Roseimicrobium sp.]
MSEPDPIFVPVDYFREARLEEIFADPSRPLEVDLGSGDGSFLVAMAAAHPERNFLGVERLIGRVAKTVKRIGQRNLTNARVLRLESTYTLAWLLPAASIARLHLLCPDPWPKKGHHWRRLFNDSEFLLGLRRALAPGGELLLKTDDLPYYENALEVMAAQADYERLDWPEEAFFYAQTDFEQQWRALCKPMHRARWQKR